MPKHTTTDRKRLFRAALALRKMTAGQWAQAEGISESFLSLLLSEKRQSEQVTARIDAFIEKHLNKHAALAS